ncbi:helix-turn-helix domain-containing protein [Naasia aerilata]|uniref:helix-turn-helix domain-containing protein n=1 Tax=Naasia aerilata TaxID=1162966 RepID=UPI002572ACD7|nr:XRE family transcriptional regulator [Naasia aerilata]
MIAWIPEPRRTSAGSPSREQEDAVSSIGTRVDVTDDGSVPGRLRPLGHSDPQASRLGRRVRALRLARDLTLVELAELAGLSHPFLSQLERGLARPSMTSLERIARALGTSQLELFAVAEEPAVEGADTAPSLVRASEGAVGPYAEGRARLLVRGRRQFQPMEFEGSNADPGVFYVHDEDEFLTVLAGIVRVELDGEGEWLLEPGDSLYWRSRTPHRWSSPGASPIGCCS